MSRGDIVLEFEAHRLRFVICSYIVEMATPGGTIDYDKNISVHQAY